MINTISDLAKAVCPRCGEMGRFDVDIAVTARVVDGQIVGYADNAEMHDEGDIRCTACDFHGSTLDFEAPYLSFSAATYPEGSRMALDEELRLGTFGLSGDLDFDAQESTSLQMPVASMPKGKAFASARIKWTVDQLMVMGATVAGRVFDIFEDDEITTHWEAPAYPLNNDQEEWVVKRFILFNYQNSELIEIHDEMMRRLAKVY